jgi:hypothetical protein
VCRYLGNCPKYITQRTLSAAPPDRPPALLRDCRTASRCILDEAALTVISHASTVYVGTIHMPLDASDNADMGLNQRGGAPGFVRTYDSGEDSFVVIPDYSGRYRLQQHSMLHVVRRYP